MTKMFGFLVCCVFVILLQTSASPINNGPGMFGNHFQGDIKLTPEQLLMVEGSPLIAPNTGRIPTNFRWPTNLEGHVIVPFRIDPSEGFTQSEVDWMINEFRVIESSTCIRFVERTFQIDFVEIINGNGCWSFFGRIGGRQTLSLDSPGGCLRHRGIAMHEAIHALGYMHMQSSIDRDNYVSIMWDNIAPSNWFNFNMIDPEWYSNFDTPYDLLSVMHYPRRAFSINGQDTVVTHDARYLDVIGAPSISSGDITRLNRMYECRS